MLKITQSVGFYQGIELVVLELGIDEFGERERIEIGIWKFHARLLRKKADETNIEICVVGDEDGFSFKRFPTDEIEERAQSLRRFGSAFYHIVGDARQRLDLLGDRHFWIDKGVKALEHFPILDLDGADFCDAAILDRKTGRFNIEHHGRRIKRSVVDPGHGTGGIVDKICLHAVENLDVRLGACLFLQIVQIGHRLRERLHVAVIGDGNGGVPPLHGSVKSRLG